MLAHSPCRAPTPGLPRDGLPSVPSCHTAQSSCRSPRAQLAGRTCRVLRKAAMAHMTPASATAAVAMSGNHSSRSGQL